MKKWAFLIALCISCTSPSTMTVHHFSDLPIGTSTEELQNIAGKPYQINKKEEDAVEYVYVEKLKNGLRTTEERRYYILVRDGRVVGKRMEQSSESPYNINSYDLQTTYGDETQS